MAKKKIKSCRQLWVAYREAFAEVNCLLTMSPKTIDEDEEGLIEAYQCIIAYERGKRCFRETRYDYHKRSYVSAPNRYLAETDYVLYRLAYQDIIKLANKIRDDDSPQWFSLDYEEREVYIAFSYILSYARVRRLTSCDQRKLYNRSRAFDYLPVLRRACTY